MKEDSYSMFSTLSGVRLECFTLVQHDPSVTATCLSCLTDIIEARCTYRAWDPVRLGPVHILKGQETLQV